MKNEKLRTVVLTLGAVVVVVALTAWITIRSGAYNVAATEPHHAVTERMFASMMDNSVRRHASGIEPGPAFADPDLAEGFEHYRQMCVACHGAPGVGQGDIGKGLNPPAPDLAEGAVELEPREVFWILKNGIKMTGMPAFGPTHDDEQLWDLTAFVTRLPDMTPDEYREMVAATDDDEHGHEHH